MARERQFNKDVVLDKALLEFWRRGYEATSMQNLVDCTGLNRGSLYATYRDKRALFLASLERYDSNRRSMLARLESMQNPRDAIRQVFMSFSTDICMPGDNRGCFLTNTALELSAHDEEIRTFVAAAQADVQAFFQRMIKKGQANGLFSPKISPNDAAAGLLASMLGYVVLVRSRPEPALLKSIVDDALRRIA